MFSKLTLILALTLTISTFAQVDRYVQFRNLESSAFGVENITSQQWDSTGAFWAKTEQGILKHNGSQKRIFSAEGGAQTIIISNNIRSIHKIEEDEFWVTYQDTAALSKFNPYTEEAEHFPLSEFYDYEGDVPLVVRVKKDSKGQIWLATWGAGLVKFNQDKGDFISYIFDDNKPDTDAGQFVKDFSFLEDGRIFMTYFNGRAHNSSHPGYFDPVTETFETIDIEPFLSHLPDFKRKQIRTAIRIIHFVHQDDKGNMWLGSYSGLVHMDFENQRLDRVHQEGIDPLAQNLVNASSCVEANGKLWITTTNSGVMVVDMESKFVRLYYTDPVNTNSIPSNVITGLSIDPMENIWIANGAGNLSVYVPYIHNFKMMYWRDMQLEYSNKSAQKIPVNQLYVKNSHEVYVSSKLGVLVYDSYTMNLTDFYRFEGVYEGVKNPRLRGVENFKVIGDELFMSLNTHTYGYNMSTNRPVKYSKGYGMIQIAFRHEDKSSRKIIVHSGHISSKLKEYTDDPFKPVQLVEMEGVRISETFSFITHANNWIFSEGIHGVGRFVIYNPRDTTFKLYSPSQTESYFPDSTVKCVLIQSGPEILIGTSSALYSFDEASGESVLISSKVGLNEEEGVNSMVKDDNGNIWMALKTELLCWNPNTEKSVRYGKALGVNVSNFLPAIGQKDELGKIYFATMNGILIFDPNNVVLPKNSLTVSLDEVVMNEESLSSEELKQFLAGKSEFAYNENFFEFKLASNQVFEQAPHQFEYRLDGLNENWISCGNNRTIRFDNLQHGDYELQLRVKNAFKTESEILEIPFKINKPFWATIWFYALCFIAFIGGVYLVVKGRMKALRRRSELLEQTVTERTAEVVEQKKEAEKQRAEAELQKEIVEEKQQEITDSITYAKRIQDAILPSTELIQKNLPSSFVMYRPKDIVAGDFYWLEPLSDKELIFAAADCTGHGVPGAMVSVVCNNALNRTVREFGISDPGKLLDSTRSLVIEQFEQSSGGPDKNNATIKDGMDISLCHLNKETLELKFAGANNPLWIVRNGELIEYKGDKQPVGKFDPSSTFTTHTVQLEAADRFYLFSDGYADQFGGEKGKKFKSSSLKKLLIKIHQLSIPEQLVELEKQFDNWKGDYEQLDDVCVIGVRV